MVWVILLALLALIPASIARGKGRSFWPWYAFGVLLFLPAFIASVGISRKVRCGGCGELTAPAVRCPRCEQPLPVSR